MAYNYSPWDEEEQQNGGDQSYGNASQPRTPTTTNASGASARNTGLAAAASAPASQPANSGSLASVSSPTQPDGAATQRAAINTNSLLNSPGRPVASSGSLGSVSSTPYDVGTGASVITGGTNSGVNGGMNTSIGGPTATTAGSASGAPPTPYGSQPSMGAFTSQMSGYDQGKFGKHDPKYAIGAVESNFDPRQGITQAMLDQLNSLGIGQFSGQIGGDKFHISNGDQAFNGVTDIDAIIGSKTGNGVWGYQPEGGATDAGVAASQAGGLMDDPVQLQLAQQLGVDTNTPYWKQILQNLMDSMAQGQAGRAQPTNV